MTIRPTTRLALAALAGLLAACSPASGASAPAASAPVPPPPLLPSAEPAPVYLEPTRILDPASALRLLANKGLSLQWIDWNTRGSAAVTQDNGVWRLRGSQAEAGGKGRLFLDGVITEVGTGYFTFEGLIRITDTPDPGRRCELRKTWHFAVTQNRSYFRLREFEWCDGLTDYIDVYF